MKNLALLAAALAAGFSSFADTTNSLENFSPHFSTNMEIIWAAPTNLLPKNLWVYKRLPARPFSASVISNAFALASLQDKEIPKPSIELFFIWDSSFGEGMRRDVFSIQPASTTIYFILPNQSLSTNDVPDDETVTKRAYECAARFGLDRAHLIPNKVYVSSRASGSDQNLTNGIYARGIFLSRKLDGIGFFTDFNVATEGFAIEFGSHGQIRFFSLIWPNLETNHLEKTASPQQLVTALKAHKIVVLPNPDEETYFERLKTLATAKRFTITKITPCYGEGLIGVDPTNDVPPELIIPFAELEAVADFGKSNMTIRFVSPFIASDLKRFNVR